MAYTAATIFAVVLLSALWAFFEKRVRLFRAGFYSPLLGYEKTGRLLIIGQGIVSFVTFGICIAAFFYHGWKLGLSALLLSLTTTAVLTNYRKK